MCYIHIMAERRSEAARILSKQHPRAGYAEDVIIGAQNWSGSDLRGKAAKYGAGYARQRKHARDAWECAGGDLLRLRNSGRIVSAVLLCTDDYGNEVFASDLGMLRPQDSRGYY